MRTKRAKSRNFGVIGAVLGGMLLWGGATIGEDDQFKKVSKADRDKMEKAAPRKAPAKPKKERHVLVFSKTKGFRHGSIEHGVIAFETLGKKSGAFTIEHSEDESVINEENLKRFDAIVMMNTTGNLFEDESMRKAFSGFVKGGGGLVGIHSATDTCYNWKEYGEMMGGYFDGHPWHEDVTLKVEDPEHPCSQAFEDDTFVIKDEIYQYKEEPYSREKVRVLLSLTEGTNFKKGGMKRKDNDYPVGWVRSYGEGRVFYCNLGHRNETFWNPVVLEHFLSGMQFAMGDLDGDTTPSGAKVP